MTTGTHDWATCRLVVVHDDYGVSCDWFGCDCQKPANYQWECANPDHAPTAYFFVCDEHNGRLTAREATARFRGMNVTLNRVTK